MDNVANGELTLHIANLNSMLQHAFATCPPFREFMLYRHSVHSSSPSQLWRLVVYADDYAPGMELASRHARKEWMVYSMFVEFGSVAVDRDVYWFTLGAALTSEVARIESGLSQYGGRLLQSLFCGHTTRPRA
jgi:hypothetical protein